MSSRLSTCTVMFLPFFYFSSTSLVLWLLQFFSVISPIFCIFAPISRSFCSLPPPLLLNLQIKFLIKIFSWKFFIVDYTKHHRRKSYQQMTMEYKVQAHSCFRSRGVTLYRKAASDLQLFQVTRINPIQDGWV